MRTSIRRALLTMALGTLLVETAFASELSYTLLDFQALQQDLPEFGSQEPVPGQIVDIRGQSGEGIGIAGSLAIGDRFYAGGSFQSSILDVMGTVTNPLGVTDVTDEFDSVSSRLYVGYLLPIGTNFDLIFEVSSDSREYDFGSFAGESFDVSDNGIGAQVGFRWNPIPSFEFFSYARFSEVGDVDLNTLQLKEDESLRLGVLWYFFEDLGLGVNVDSGSVDTVSVTMRFSFGNLPW